MIEPRIAIRLDSRRRVYEPGEVLSGECRIEGVAPGQVEAVETSVLWHTEGKGDEDLAVHFFERLAPDVGDPLDPRQPLRFSARLPYSPLSYDGAIVKICWCVRVRLFLARGRSLVEEEPFQLGHVPRAARALP